MWLKLKKLLQNPIFLFIVWIGVVLLHSITTVNGEDYNNFSIFSASFFHAIDAKPLYIEYPSEYNDVFLYGIPFTAIIAPFSILPIKIGLPLWCVINAALLFYALFKLNLKKWQFALVILVSVNDMYTSVMSQQYGIAITAMIIFAFIWINKEKDFWAALMIALGTITKIYGIVGFAFFFFSKHKLKLSLSFIFWLIILALIPVLYTSFDYVLLSYKEWGEAIMHKNGLNDFTPYTNISLLGMLRKISGNANYSNLLVLVPGMILFCLPYLRIKLYGNMNFKLLYLASTLLFMILFSSGTESCGYFTGMIAVGIWFSVTPSMNKTKILNFALLIFAIYVTSFSITDLFPRYLKYNYVNPYALKALPCTLIWIKIIWDQLFEFINIKDTKVQASAANAPFNKESNSLSDNK